MGFHNIFLEPGKTKPGILITANEGIFASFGCSAFTGFSGNGVISELSSSQCGKAGNTATTFYESSAPGVQKWTQIETEGTKYDLSVNLFGGSKQTLAFDGSTTFTFAENAEFTC